MALYALVAGLLEMDSGKTWFSTALAKLMLRRGLRVSLYKPVAGHSLWHSFSAIEASMERGVLVGNDVLVYEREAGGAVRGVDRVNPVDMVTVYPDPLKLPGSGSFKAVASSVERMVALARVPAEDGGGSRHLFFRENADLFPPASRRVVERLAERLDAEEASPRAFVAWLSSAEASRDLLDLAKRLGGESDVVVVESFSDAAVPFVGLEGLVDLYIVVSPGRAVAYSGERLRKAVELIGDAGVRTTSLLGLLGREHLATWDVPPVSSISELAERLSESPIAKLFP